MEITKIAVETNCIQSLAERLLKKYRPRTMDIPDSPYGFK